MTQPVQEPSQGRINQGLEFRTRQLFRRPGPPPPPQGYYRQFDGKIYSGRQFQVLTANNNYPGGNGTAWFDGSWQWIDDPTCPFDGVALETSTNGDWWPFPLGNLGPQGTGYAVAFWFYGDTAGAQIDLEFATVSVNEFDNGTGIGSTTSVQGPSDFDFFGATPPGWYNNNNTSPDHGYRFDLSDGAAGWAIGNVIMGASTFTLEAADGTPLTANAAGFDPTWDESSEFDAGGGTDLWWWMRIRVSGGGGGSGGFLCRLGQVWVYRANGNSDFVGG